jgi:dynactin 1
MHNLPDALIEVTNDRLPGICEVRGLITVFSNLLQRLASSMSRGPPQEFLALSRLNSEFSHIEEKMDQWFDSIRRNEFSERDCSLELVGYVAELEHALGSITSGVDLDTAERQLGLALAFDYELDNFAASVGLARHGIMEMIQDPGKADEMKDRERFH